MNSQTTEDVIYPSRVAMLDAASLDAEIFSIVKNQLVDILPAWLLKDERFCNMSIHLFLWTASTYQYHSSFGQKFLNVKYENANKTKLCLLETWNLIQHFFAGFDVTLQNLQEAPALTAGAAVQTMRRVHILIMGASFLNRLIFLRQGKYPTIGERILNLKTVCVVSKPKKVGYSFMMREMMWHSFIELLSFTLSLVNYQYLKRSIFRLLVSIVKKNKIVEGIENKDMTLTPNTVCFVCHMRPTLAQNIGCDHVFCYYCIQSNRLLDSKFECPECGYYGETSFAKLS